MSTIKTGTTLTTAYQVVGDTTGALVIQTGATPTTAMTISSAQVVTFANPPAGVFPSGTAMMFVQTAAPTGWTKSTAHDNKALRVVSGTASSGGSVNFTTAFASQAVSGTVGNTTLTEAQMPSHTHRLGGAQNGDFTGLFGGGQGGWGIASTSNNNIYRNFADNTGGSQAHNHSFTGTAINMAVQYVDVIIATKD